MDMLRVTALTGQSFIPNGDFLTPSCQNLCFPADAWPVKQPLLCTAPTVLVDRSNRLCAAATQSLFCFHAGTGERCIVHVAQAIRAKVRGQGDLRTHPRLLPSAAGG